MSEKRTIARLWSDAVRAGRSTPAYLEQHGDEWRPVSWTEAAERVDAYANGRVELGEGRRLHPRALGERRDPVRGRGAAGEGGVGARRDPATPARPRVRRP